MNDQHVISEIKKAAALFTDGTFNENDLAARLKQIVDERCAEDALHKAVVEQLMHAVDGYFETKRLFRSGHQSKLDLSTTEDSLRMKVGHLKNRGYSVERFEKKHEQKNLF